jgi:hypothetical protein
MRLKTCEALENLLQKFKGLAPHIAYHPRVSREVFEHTFQATNHNLALICLTRHVIPPVLLLIITDALLILRHNERRPAGYRAPFRGPIADKSPNVIQDSLCSVINVVDRWRVRVIETIGRGWWGLIAGLGAAFLQGEDIR